MDLVSQCAADDGLVQIVRCEVLFKKITQVLNSNCACVLCENNLPLLNGVTGFATWAVSLQHFCFQLSNMWFSMGADLTPSLYQRLVQSHFLDVSLEIARFAIFRESKVSKIPYRSIETLVLTACRASSFLCRL